MNVVYKSINHILLYIFCFFAFSLQIIKIYYYFCANLLFYHNINFPGMPGNLIIIKYLKLCAV